MTDTSPEYIKMCDCPEIQEYLKQKIDDEEYIGNIDIHCKYGVIMGAGLVLVHALLDHNEMTWLPDQRQLQEMVDLTDYTIWYNDCEWIVMSITNCLRSDEQPTKYPSAEQALLSFVMHELHNKTWDGERWVDDGHE